MFRLLPPRLNSRLLLMLLSPLMLLLPLRLLLSRLKSPSLSRGRDVRPRLSTTDSPIPMLPQLEFMLLPPLRLSPTLPPPQLLYQQLLPLLPMPELLLSLTPGLLPTLTPELLLSPTPEFPPLTTPQLQL